MDQKLVRMGLSALSVVLMLCLYWKAAHSNTTSLRSYMCKPLEEAVDAYNDRHYDKSLSLISKLTQSSPALTYESVYLQGLCLQSLGRFEEAQMAYRKVLAKTRILALKEKAEEALALCLKRRRSIPEELTEFPKSEESGQDH
jgi:tetratricopeptide (TPR) repeat protein